MNKYDSDELIHKKNGDLEYLEFKVLNKYNVKNAVTLRHGGVSKGEYSSLNFRSAGNDLKENVLKNIDIIRKEKGFSNVYKGMQAHTDRVVVIDDSNKENYLISNFSEEEVDGYIINKKGIATLITTADCNPLIIFDPVNRTIANVHAGWKGVLNKIYINAINIMCQKFNANPKDLIVCIGPSIRDCCFTSKEESFKEKFTSIFPYEEEYLYTEKDNVTFHIDMIKILKNEFVNRGVKLENIHDSKICTRCNVEEFYSYRYSVQNSKKDYGTFATIVEL